jgi:hypothetical protein
MPSAHTPLGICFARESDIDPFLHSSEEDMKALLPTAATILVVSAVLIALATSAPAAPTPAASASGTPLIAAVGLHLFPAAIRAEFKSPGAS